MTQHTTQQAIPQTSRARSTGRGFAYSGVLVGLGVSVWANIAHAMTPPASAPKDWPAHTPWEPARWHADPGALGLAGFWPLILFLALEVLTRTQWRKGRGLWVARGGVSVVAAVAAVVSYLHLHGLLDHYGEATVPALIGPLAIDGLMAVSTAALFAARPTADQATNKAATKDDTSSRPVVTGSSAGTPGDSSAPSPSRSSSTSSRASSRASSSRSSAGSSRASSAGSSGKARPVDDETLRALVAQARAERPGAGEPAVRRLLAEHGLSASAARVRAALAAPAAGPPGLGEDDENGQEAAA